MNGPDLRFLAERAAGLEDHTTERLTGVHDRIATVRRRRRASATAGVAALVVALVVGLAFFDNDPGRKTPSPAPTPTPTTTPFDPIGSAPAKGTCWAVDPNVTNEDDDWFDDSPQVPCDEPHTTETAGYLYLTDATVAEARKQEGNCAATVRSYMSLGLNSWIPWGTTLFLPSRALIAEGAKWLRCDAALPSAWYTQPTTWPGLRTLTMSVAYIADDPPPELQACLDKPPTQDQPYVSCEELHAYEQTGTAAHIAGEPKYPSAAKRDEETQKQCSDDVPEGVTDVSVTAVWDAPEGFEPGNEVGAVCFFFHTDGTPLPPQ